MKDPAFLFYPSDWLSGTLGMTFEEKGAYLELLLVQFNQGHMNEHIVQRIVGELWQSIRHKFLQDEKGLWYNVRLEQEQAKRSKFTESRRKNISKRYEATYVGTKTLHMENENENKHENKHEKQKQKFDFKGELLKYGFHPELVDEWMQVRKNKRLTNTQTAYNAFIGEVCKVKVEKNKLLAYIVSKSWGSFKAQWYERETMQTSTGATAQLSGMDYSTKF